jgi:tetratricopeptide (TPR) repeat protein
MVKKSRQYTNPFFKAKEPKLGSRASAIPSLQDALELHQQGRLNQAELIYRQHLESEPTNSDALHLLGVIAHQTGRHIAAAEMIGRAIEINPNAPNYYSNRALSLHALKQLEAAVASYDRAIALKPDYYIALNNRGTAKLNTNDYTGALSDFNAALKQKPNYILAINNIASVYIKKKEYKAAADWADKAIQLDATLGSAYLNRGIAKQMLKDEDGACADWKKAAEFGVSEGKTYSAGLCD